MTGYLESVGDLLSLSDRSIREIEAVLGGPIPGLRVLHSILERIRDMNLLLISVARIESSSEDES
jgi:hypothetical protein